MEKLKLAIWNYTILAPPPHLPHFCKNFYRAQTWYKSSHDTPDGRPWGFQPGKNRIYKLWAFENRRFLYLEKFQLSTNLYLAISVNVQFR